LISDERNQINSTPIYELCVQAQTPAVHEQISRVRPQILINAARAFKAAAEPLKAHFIAHEMSADFLDELQEDLDDFESAISDQSSGVGNRVAAGAGLDELIERGNEIVRKLDAIVRNKYANNAAVLAEWTSASHTERAPRRAKPAPPPATPTT